jgi:hypothetical protein
MSGNYRKRDWAKKTLRTHFLPKSLGRLMALDTVGSGKRENKNEEEKRQNCIRGSCRGNYYCREIGAEVKLKLGIAPMYTRIIVNWQVDLANSTEYLFKSSGSRYFCVH